MEEARRKIRIFLAAAVTVAVIVGLIYYFHDVQGSAAVNGGTLIVMPGGFPLWR